MKVLVEGLPQVKILRRSTPKKKGLFLGDPRFVLKPVIDLNQRWMTDLRDFYRMERFQWLISSSQKPSLQNSYATLCNQTLNMINLDFQSLKAKITCKSIVKLKMFLILKWVDHLALSEQEAYTISKVAVPWTLTPTGRMHQLKLALWAQTDGN